MIDSKESPHSYAAARRRTPPHADLAKLAATGAVPAGPAPLPPAEDGQAIEVERPVSRGGLVCLGPHRLLAAEILGGQLVGIRIPHAATRHAALAPLPLPPRTADATPGRIVG